ncbi:GPI-anchored surface protein, putative [Bodo saltans]|uniref:GPI-anchored surface protein, putative n=1 Tax=Bodo saltans TaxID=75058 RepID=A0A0S4II64_BODSA|nr:GPI-anchored surface protein, putative [Bodo saltans]|eukprot:CUE70801.1 GPI-anchored surface protein, putative [Bodo saltans]
MIFPPFPQRKESSSENSRTMVVEFTPAQQMCRLTSHTYLTAGCRLLQFSFTCSLKGSVTHRDAMITHLKLLLKFERLTLRPYDALFLFREMSFDDTVVRNRVTTSMIWNMCVFSEETSREVLAIFRERKLLNNLDLRLASRVLDSVLAEPGRVRSFDIESTLYLSDVARYDDQKAQLSWVVDRYSAICTSPDVETCPEFLSLTFPLAARMLDTYPLALRWCNIAATRLGQFYESATPPLLEQTLSLLQVMTRLGHDACPAELRAIVIKNALTSNGLPTAGALAAIDSFAIMGCWNAVGAMLLKYHGTLATLTHGGWTSCCQAALKANVQNPNTRRALLKRGAELRNRMNLNELELQCRCEQLWADVCSPAWISISEVVERIRVAQTECTDERLITFVNTSTSSRQHHHIGWALLSALVHRVGGLSWQHVLEIMRTLRNNRFRHESMIHRLGLYNQALNFDLALEFFFFCEAFRISCSHPGNSLIAPSEVILVNLVLVSYSEALSIMRAMLVCSFQQNALMQSMLGIVSSAMDKLSSQQLYVLAACHRLCDNGDKRLTAAIECRAHQLVETLPA